MYPELQLKLIMLAIDVGVDELSPPTIKAMDPIVKATALIVGKPKFPCKTLQVCDKVSYTSMEV